MSVSASDRFASNVKRLDELPEPFQSAVLQHLSPQHHIRLMVWGPASKTIRSKSPAAVLTVTNKDWIVVAEAQHENTAVARCDFANTLLIELTSILLYGRLKIDYVNEGRVEFISIDFNTVMERLYQEAIQLLIDEMNGVSLELSVEDKPLNPLFHALPLKFQNAVLEYKPGSRAILSVLHWSAVFRGNSRWIHHELTPEAILLLTERELMLISEDKARSWFGSRQTRKHANTER